MWRDPLDELIDDLERASPASRSASADLLPIEKLQQITDLILYGRPDEVETLTSDPTFQEWMRRCSDLRRRSEEERRVSFLMT
jgi:hypothetical protein